MRAWEELDGRSHRVGWGCGVRILHRVIREAASIGNLSRL